MWQKKLQNLDEHIFMVYIVVMVAYNAHNNPNKLEKDGRANIRS